jgi:hypothetical protein
LYRILIKEVEGRTSSPFLKATVKCYQRYEENVCSVVPNNSLPTKTTFVIVFFFMGKGISPVFVIIYHFALDNLITLIIVEVR